MYSLLTILALFLSSFGPSSSLPLSVGSRSILRAITINKGDQQRDFAVDLNATNFDSVLKDTPATYAIVEFFAHWCPACRNYKPQYEKVAKLFNGADAVQPGLILMTRVDCASKCCISPPYLTCLAAQINTNLCDRFSITHYPMLFWGPPSKFVSGSGEPKQEKSEIQSIDDGRTADRLLNWINKQLGSSYKLGDERYGNDNLLPNISDPGQIARAIFDVEEATSTVFDIILEHKMIKSETRAALIKFLQLMAVHHPSRRCRKGSADILVNFDDLHPSEFISLTNKQDNVIGIGKGSFGNFQICGKGVPRGYWMFCRGSKNDTRGFSCGLWVLLHSLSVKVDDGESQLAFSATCDFITNFFICEDCRQHFNEMCSSVSTPFKKARDFMLWLWSTHNKVNERLMKVEANLETGDPKFPKIIWPPKQLCPNCYKSTEKDKDGKVQWDHYEVAKFLASYYGNTLVSLYKNKEVVAGYDGAISKKLVGEDVGGASANALVVPLGAALAIAVASCAFGALACFWRSRQKNRKPRRSWT